MALLSHGRFLWGRGGSITEDKVVRVARCVNGLHPGGATLPCGGKIAICFYCCRYFYQGRRNLQKIGPNLKGLGFLLRKLRPLLDLLVSERGKRSQPSS